MKTILLFLILAVPAGARAQWGPSALAQLRAMQAEEAPAPPVPKAAPAFSDSFTALIDNPDGSATLVEPAFRNPTGVGPLPISTQSPREGVCKLFGLGAPYGTITEGPHIITAYINSNGQFAGFRQDNFRISHLICGKGLRPRPQPPKASERAESLHGNDDGSVTLVRPFLKGAGKSRFWISSLDYGQGGACRHFGLGEYVAHTSTWRAGLAAVMNRDGHVYHFHGSNRLETLICRPTEEMK